MTVPTAVPCAACNALAGEPCSPDCLGLADATDHLNGTLIPDAVPAYAVPSDVCSVCGRYNDEAFHGRCIVSVAPPARLDAHCTTCQDSPARHAHLHAGHVWTAVRCPAYRTLDGRDCACSP